MNNEVLVLHITIPAFTKDAEAVARALNSGEMELADIPQIDNAIYGATLHTI